MGWASAWLASSADALLLVEGELTTTAIAPEPVTPSREYSLIARCPATTVFAGLFGAASLISRVNLTEVNARRVSMQSH